MSYAAGHPLSLLRLFYIDVERTGTHSPEHKQDELVIRAVQCNIRNIQFRALGRSLALHSLLCTAGGSLEIKDQMFLLGLC